MTRKSKARVAGVMAALLALLLCAGAFTAAAAPEAVVYTLQKTDGEVGLTKSGAAPWERPTLPAGQTRAPQVLRLVNATEQTAVMSLQSIELPYTNQAAMRYFTKLHVTVKHGDEVLYDGPYSYIMDKNGLQFSAELAPGASAELTVAMRCAFSYTGQAAQDTAAVAWRFSAAQQAVDAGWLTTLLVVLGVVVVLLAAGGAAAWFFLRRRQA